MPVTLRKGLAAASLAVLLAGAAMAADPKQGARIVELHCNMCHNYERVCRNLGKGDAWWLATVKRMIQNGAGVDDDQAADVAAYPAGLAPGAPALCK